MHVQRQLWAGLTILSFVSQASAQATESAQVQSVTMHWKSLAPGCLDQASLESLVEATLGRPVFHSRLPAAATVEGQVEAAPGGGYQARVVLRSRTGKVLAQRELETSAPLCDRLDESVAVVVTLMIDELRPEPVRLRVPAKPPRARQPALSLALAAGGGVSQGLLPSVSPFAIIRGEVESSAFLPLALSLRGWAPTERLVGGVGARFSAWNADWTLCPALVSRAPLRLGLCAGAGTLLVQASSVGLVGGSDSIKVVGYAAASVVGAVRLISPVWLRLDASALVPLRRLHYWYHDRDGTERVVHDGSVSAPTISLAIEVRSGS